MFTRCLLNNFGNFPIQKAFKIGIVAKNAENGELWRNFNIKSRKYQNRSISEGKKRARASLIIIHWKLLQSFWILRLVPQKLRNDLKFRKVIKLAKTPSGKSSNIQIKKSSLERWHTWNLYINYFGITKIQKLYTQKFKGFFFLIVIEIKF